MVAIPLAATVFTAIMRWQRSREVSPTAESSRLNTGLNLYGTLKTNGSSNSEINSNTFEENGNGKYSTYRMCFLKIFSRRCITSVKLCSD